MTPFLKTKEGATVRHSARELKLPARPATSLVQAKGRSIARVPELFDIELLRVPTLPEALVHREALRQFLTEEEQRSLRIVRIAPTRRSPSRPYAVVFGANLPQRDIASAIARLQPQLEESDFVAAQPLSSRSYQPLFNIVLGAAQDFASLTERYGLLIRTFGQRMSARLVIEQLANGSYQLVHQSLGSKVAAQAEARLLNRRLTALGFKGEAVEANGGRIVYGFEQWVNLNHLLALSPRRPPVQAPSGADETLQLAVQGHVDGLSRKRVLARGERLAFAALDLGTGEQILSINADERLQAASMIKPFVLLTLLHEVSAGRLIYGPRTRAKMELMIQYSNNEATNWAIGLLGGPAKVQQILEMNYPQIFRATEIVEQIPPGGRSYRNRSSAADYLRFLQALWYDELPQSKEIKRLMLLPGYDRMRDRARSLPTEAVVLNKTGTTARLCGDMGVIAIRDAAGATRAYAFIGIIERPQRTRERRWNSSRAQIIGQVSDLVFAEVKERYRFR